MWRLAEGPDGNPSSLLLAGHVLLTAEQHRPYCAALLAAQYVAGALLLVLTWHGRPPAACPPGPGRGPGPRPLRDVRPRADVVASHRRRVVVGSPSDRDPGSAGDYRALSDDAVWAEVERGAGTGLPYRALQVGDTRCNRTTWGVWSGRRYVPVLDDTDPRDLRARDAFLRALPGNLLFAPRPLAALRIARALLAHPRAVPVALAWAARFTRRAGIRALRGVHPTTM